MNCIFSELTVKLAEIFLSSMFQNAIFMPGCFEVILVGQNMTSREEKQLLVECQPFIHQLQGVITHDHDE